jgi:hypothetical protein
MNCDDARKHLSAYFDGELADELRAVVAEHLQTCAECTAALARIRSISLLAKKLPAPAQGDLWPGIERALSAQPLAQPAAEETSGFRMPARLRWPLAIAASLLIGFFTWPFVHPQKNAHDEMAINLSHYIEVFGTDPSAAEQTLRAQYSGKPIRPADAVKLVAYRPLAPPELDDAAIRSQMYLFEMPCCKCVQSLYRRADGGVLAVFEHVDEQPAWFGKRPTIHAKCGNTDVCLIECNGQLAASWKQGERFVTLVGIKNLEEVSQLMGQFNVAS